MTAPASAEETLTVQQALTQALDIALEIDESVILLGEDISDPSGGVFGVTRGLSTKHGVDRVLATPISEQAIIGASVGAAIGGLRPVPEIMLMNFVAVAMDQIVNHAAKLRYMSGGQTTVPLTIRTATGGGRQFGAQHSDMLEAWFTHVAGLKVVVPSNPADAKGLLLSCIFDDDPCVFIEQHALYFTEKGPVPTGDYRIPLGKARIARPGTDATIVTYGRQVIQSLAAAASLAGEGIDVEVVDLRTLVPLDLEAILASVSKTKRAVVVHEAVRRSGFGAEIAATISEELYDELVAPVLRVAGANTPVPYATELEQAYLPQQSDIEAAVRAVSKYGSI
jgi:pyruvate dehydrogenase E1 component beta subunit